MPQKYDAIVIGSGLGGLTAGAMYARIGYRVLLLERNQNFGGAASVYQHGELSIESSLHETTNPHQENDPCHRIFKTLGILDDIEFISVPEFYEVRSKLLKIPFVFPHGLLHAKDVLKTRFPSHAQALDVLFDRFDKSGQIMNLMNGQHSGSWWLLHIPSLLIRFWPLLRELKKSLADVFQKLFDSDEAIKLALAANLGYYADDPQRMWWFFYTMAQGGYISGGGHYIRGGSQALTNRLIKVIEDNGGIARSGRLVTRILLDAQGKACGVEHESHDGSDTQTNEAPVLFGNAAPHVLAEALPADVRETFMQNYRDKPLSLSLFSINLGLSRHPVDFGVGSYSTVLIPDWMTSLSEYRCNTDLLKVLPGDRCPVLTIVDYSRIDTGLNIRPPYLMAVVGLDQLENWQSLSSEDYHHKRDQWLGAIIRWLDAEYPGLASAVMQKEMLTALSMHRYLNTPGGALYGFAPLPPKKLSLKHPPRTPKTTIEGLWLASAYANSGGFTGAILGGAMAARMAMYQKGER